MSSHPALTVSNIRLAIPMVLDMEKQHYSSWAELFKIHCRAFQVTHHILPDVEVSDTSSQASITAIVVANTETRASEADNLAATNTESGTAVTTAPAAPVSNQVLQFSTTPNTELWFRVDAVVLQWIYGTISGDLLQMIIEPDTTVARAWSALRGIFQDNRHTRIVHLENQFSNTRLDAFTGISAYCQELKSIADQLTNVGAPVSNNRLVVQLVTGLSSAYDHVAALIQQRVPLPLFHEARSQLILEEIRKQKQVSVLGSPSALVSQVTDTDTRTAVFSGRNQRGRSSRGQDRSVRGRTRSRGGHSKSQTQSEPHKGNNIHMGSNFYPNMFGPGVSPWQVGPCPYPTQAIWPGPYFSLRTNSNNPHGPSPQLGNNNTSQQLNAQGLLGPSPSSRGQAHSHQHSPAHSYLSQAPTSRADYSVPTDIDAAFNSMTLNPPDQYYMDSGLSDGQSYAEM